MKIIVAAAVNEPDTLAQCLARSPDILSGALALRTYTGYATAGAAYNAAIADADDADVIVFAHQDVYLPSGSLSRLNDQLERLTVTAPDWALAGVIGGTIDRRLVGQTWCSGHHRMLGSPITNPVAVITLDEMVLILRVYSGLRFDDRLPGFHLYGADMVLTAWTLGLSNWVLALPAVHHSRPVISLRGSYFSAYRYIQRKWNRELPVYNLVCPLERTLWRYWLTEARLWWRHHHLSVRPSPNGDPVMIARQIGYES